MSPRDRTEHVTLLRAAIAKIEGEGGSVRERRRGIRNKGEPVPKTVPLGPEGFGIDRLLGGGLRRGALHEIVPASARDEAAASGFALALAARCLASQKTLIWIIDDRAADENGLPYRPGLQSHGLDPDRLVVVRTQGGAMTLWACEEALRTRDFVVLTELWGSRDYGLAPSRRLVLAAQANGAIGLLVHAGLPNGAEALSSGSAMRFRIGACPSPRIGTVAKRLPAPGAPAFAVHLDKIRGAAGDFDPQNPFFLAWSPEQGCFHDLDLPVALASPPADRPAEANRGRQPAFG